MSAPTLLDYALVAFRAGLNVWPPKQDGSKQPDREAWKELRHRRVTETEIARLYANPRRTGIGTICGAISGGLALFEFDDRASALAEFETLVADNGLWDLWQSIIAGYWERSPSGGLRTFIRAGRPEKNDRLASRPKRPEEMRHAKDLWQVLVETRAEGGYAVIAPSFGSVHATGMPYELLRGELATIRQLNDDDWENLRAIARMLDKKPAQRFESSARRGRDGSRPGDHFNAATTWEALLPKYGWTRVRQSGQETFWRRPGKSDGWSATTNYEGSGVLKVFSTSTPLDTEQTYTPFGFYAVMEHDGDFQAAAKALYALGYRDPIVTITRPRGRQPIIDLSAPEACHAR